MSEVEDPRIGTTIDGRYRILDRIGRGGMGCVYRAEHTGMRKPVALKLLAPKVGESTRVDRARFEREAFATGRLSHPNCVAVTDFGALDDGTLYLAMELLGGTTLADLLEGEGRLPAARALHIMQHILRGLAHAHDLGIVHRDLKTQNVMLIEHLGDSDFAKVLDFGLAKLIGEARAIEGGGKLTAAGITFGTPHYISPEQAFGNPVDHRADLYSASVMLFEMVAGALPFTGSDIRSILLAHATRAVPRIHEVAPGLAVPVEVELLARQGMAKDPRDRMSTATEYLARVEQVLATLERNTTTRMPTHTPVPERIAVAPTTPAPSPAPQPAPSVAPAVPPVADVTVPLAPPLASPAPMSGASMAAVRSPAPRRRWPVAAALTAIALVGVIAALAIPGRDTAAPAAAAAESTAPAALPVEARSRAGEAPAAATSTPTPAAAPATAELERAIARARGLSEREAEKTLVALRKAHPRSGAVVYALGRHYFDRPWPPKALAAYRDAIALDPAYRADPVIIEQAIRLLSSHSSRGAAARLLERDVGEPALPALDAAARSHGNPKVRARAAAIARAIRNPG